MRKIGVNENMFNCPKIMNQDKKFCVKCGENLISSCATPKKGGDPSRSWFQSTLI